MRTQAILIILLVSIALLILLNSEVGAAASNMVRLKNVSGINNQPRFLFDQCQYNWLSRTESFRGTNLNFSVIE